jgi:putative ABC transport system permease protein
MKLLKLIAKNSMRHKLRTLLTILGLALAVMAFGLIRTFINAWYAGERAASPDRIITRHSASIIFELPLAYKERILKIDGVENVTYANWFGGYYVDPKNFFAQFALDASTWFDVYPEFIVPPDQLKTFNAERNAAIVGRGLADRFGWKLGDAVTLIGTVYSGDWNFVIRGIYTGKDQDTDETLFFFHYEYLNEWIQKEWSGYGSNVGWYAVKIKDPSRAAEISAAIDAQFDNSPAETKTETEKEFQMSFIQLMSAIITGLRIISYLIIGVMLLVMVNTMVMTARERISENAFMRTLGFRGYHLVGLILGESLFIGLLGGIVGMLLLALVSSIVAIALRIYFPGFQADVLTYLMCIVGAFLVSMVASIFPIQRALRIKIVDGLRVVD